MFLLTVFMEICIGCFAVISEVTPWCETVELISHFSYEARVHEKWVLGNIEMAVMAH